MTENAINLLLVIPSLAVIMLITGAQAVSPTEGVLRRRKESQLNSLCQVATSSEERLELDWLRYKEIPKDQVLTLANQQGWHFESESIEEHSWLLRFARSRASTELGRTSSEPE